MDPKEISDKIDRAVSDDDHPFRHLARLRSRNAFFDIRAVERHFAYFDRWYPGARFILHTRSRDAWIESRRRHVQYNIDHGHTTWATVDEGRWIQTWDDHHAAVLSHFQGRERDLLVFEVSAGDGWPELCRFLGRPEPDTPFPHSNAAIQRG